MVILWVNIRVRPPPSWNSVFGTTWLRFSSRSRFRARVTGLGSNTFYQIQIQIQIHFFQSFKYKYKYKYTDKNLIKYKYKYKYSPSNTNTNTNTHWGRDKIDAILQMTYSNSFCCKNIVLFIQISMKTVSKGPIYNKPGCLLWFRQWLGTE